MAEPELVESSGDPRCDRILRGVVGIFESSAGDRGLR
jgi:hypothetical protein